MTIDLDIGREDDQSGVDTVLGENAGSTASHDYNSALWSAFMEINRCRRAVRDFDDRPVADDVVEELLAEAMLAPSSVNLQPYQFHWIKKASTNSSIVDACNRQRAAASAAAIIFVVASTEIARKTAVDQLAYIDASTELSDRSKAYNRNQLQKLGKVLSYGSWPIWSLLIGLVALFRPSLSLLPLGHLGSRGWAARNAIFAAQTLQLAASARGIDSCPMEGFSAPKVAAALGLPRGTVVAVAIALGYRKEDARIEPQWRRPFADVVISH
ncbi:nitroreductase [Agrobacterium vitis]|nr:nitroreductase [Agrobacterium vitis]MBE1440346.1 nitroreductase [Agrobacterium vitis]